MNFSFHDLLDKVKKFNVYQKIAAGVLAVTIPVSIGLGISAVTAYSSVNAPGSGGSFATTGLMSSSKQESSQMDSSQSTEPIKVYLKPSSVEEDLEVQIVDEESNLVTGAEFKLTVTGKANGYNKVWPVDDGFLKLTKLQSGDYTVSIEPKDGYIVPEEPVQCKVEKKVDYVKIDVSDKLVDDSKVDSSKEDAGYTSTKPTTPPATVKDTVEFVASSSKEEEQDVETVVIKYKPILGDGGRLKNQDGSTSAYYPKLDTDGYLTGATLAPQITQTNTRTSSYKIMLLGLGEENMGNSDSDSESSEPLLQPEPSSSEVNSVSSSDSVQSSSQSSESSSEVSSSSDESSSSSDSADSSSSAGSSSSIESSSDSSSDTSSSNSSSGSSSGSELPQEVVLFDSEGNPILGSDNKPLFMMEKVEVKTTEKKKVTVYYGWQTLDGKKYFYDKNGKKVTGTQVIQGITYYFDKNGIMGNRIGIDVSKYQGNIDWNAVKNSGIEFAIIRVGYRGYGTGVLVEDPYFRKNIQGATNAGLKVGVYVFSQAINTREAVEEASMCLAAVKGYKLDYPIFFDTEYSTSRKDGRADGLSKSHRTTIAKAFCETIQNSGYKAGVYASKSWFYNQLEYSQISSYSIWVAHYASSTDFAYRYDIWQYSGSGTCRGIGGAVDMNIGYTAY